MKKSNFIKIPPPSKGYLEVVVLKGKKYCAFQTPIKKINKYSIIKIFAEALNEILNEIL